MTDINEGWNFAHGMEGGGPFAQVQYQEVDLPHDYMISNPVREDAAAGPAMGFFTEGVAHYVKRLDIPEDWEGQEILLRLDGAMMNATVYVNGDRVMLHHNGYFPFEANITRQIYTGKENEIRIVLNPSMQPNSRWYSGAGLLRGVDLVALPKVHIAMDGVYGYTDHVDYDKEGKPIFAQVKTQVEVVNADTDFALAKVEVSLVDEATGALAASSSQLVQIKGGSSDTAYIALSVENPKLWSLDAPQLYRLKAKVTKVGSFKTHIIYSENQTEDEASTLFGIRTITADAKNGLRINGVETKLKGGCIHHDNGLLGAVSLYDAEYRKIKKLKEVGFNAVRTTHNPPSRALLEACDRLGMYVFDEAFDCWAIGKQPGDYNMFFETDWESDLTAFIKRDRSHPAVIIWSIGNEIFERGGLGGGYSLATKLAKAVKSLDASRPVSNGICSFWSGLDNELMEENQKAFETMLNGETGNIQNADMNKDDTQWEEMSEAFANGLDIVGYNYMEDKYIRDHEMFPERVILGSENYPKEIGKRWPLVESLPYAIGDFTWTAYDYIGEAGIGKSAFVTEDDPIKKAGSFALMSHSSQFPWRLANDADIDINGNVRPQGDYRSIVWGSGATKVYTYDPVNYGREEIISPWGFTDVKECYTWPGFEGKPMTAVVFSAAQEVELVQNGKSLGRKGKEQALAVEDLPCSFVFDITYEPGELTAISYENGAEVSRDTIATTGQAAGLTVQVEAGATGQISYVEITVVDSESARVFLDQYQLRAEVGPGVKLLAFGSANPVTDEIYTDNQAKTYRGQATAIVSGRGQLTISSETLGTIKIDV